MKYFKKIADGFDVAAAVAELSSVKRCSTGLTAADRCRFAARGLKDPEAPGALILHRPYDDLPSLRALEVAALRAVDGRFSPSSSRVRVIPAGAAMRPHRDQLGDNHARLHLALQCDDRAVFHIKNERCRFKPGELWHVDLRNRLHHVVNGSRLPRIMLMIDGIWQSGADSSRFLHPGAISLTNAINRRAWGNVA